MKDEEGTEIVSVSDDTAAHLAYQKWLYTPKQARRAPPTGWEQAFVAGAKWERGKADCALAAALQAQSELLDALAGLAESFFPKWHTLADECVAEPRWRKTLNLLVKHGRVTKTPSGAFEWATK